MRLDEPTRLAAIAATRFGLGARGPEIHDAALDAPGSLLGQLAAGARAPETTTTPERLAAERAVERISVGVDAVSGLRRSLADADLLWRARHGAETSAPYVERWALFWLNHFALRVLDGRAEMLAGAFAREVVDAHLLGRFDDLLVAAVQHPAMLLSLDQLESVGPNSVAGRGAGRGLNENLAREILELHTFGAEAGYDQGDVAELARALTGWRYGDPTGPAESAGRFLLDAERHEPGVRRLLGRTYDGSPGSVTTMVRDLANRPETRRRLAFKAARHFVSDRPPASLVARLTEALNQSDGSLRALAEALVLAPEAWAPAQAKFKTPYEFAVSAYRAVGSAPDDAAQFSSYVRGTGHSPLWAPTAAGSPDQAEAWMTPLGLNQRAQLAWTVAERADDREPAAWAGEVIGPLLTPETARLVRARASSPRNAIALALLSPEFQRR